MERTKTNVQAALDEMTARMREIEALRRDHPDDPRVKEYDEELDKQYKDPAFLARCKEWSDWLQRERATVGAVTKEGR